MRMDEQKENLVSDGARETIRVCERKCERKKKRERKIQILMDVWQMRKKERENRIGKLFFICYNNTLLKRISTVAIRITHCGRSQKQIT